MKGEVKGTKFDELERIGRGEVEVEETGELQLQLQPWPSHKRDALN